MNETRKIMELVRKIRKEGESVVKIHVLYSLPKGSTNKKQEEIVSVHETLQDAQASLSAAGDKDKLDYSVREVTVNIL